MRDMYGQVFLNNKYTNYYFGIVNKATERKQPICGGEKHHIIPMCLFKKNRSKNKRPGWIEGDPHSAENLVLLSFREHFICHWLLTKMMLKLTDKIKMEYALSCFSKTIKNNLEHTITSIEHARLKLARQFIVKTIPSQKGKKQDKSKGSWWTNGLQEKVSLSSPGDAWRKGRLSSPLKGKQNTHSKGAKWWNNGVTMVVSKICPGDTWVLGRLQLSKIKKHKKHVCPPCSEITKQKISLANIGRKRSLETREKMSKDRQGRPTVTKGSKWYNNGTTEVRKHIPPGDGWSVGKLKKS
jgi:hypothetical protein